MNLTPCNCPMLPGAYLLHGDNCSNKHSYIKSLQKKLDGIPEDKKASVDNNIFKKVYAVKFMIAGRKYKPYQIETSGHPAFKTFIGIYVSSSDNWIYLKADNADMNGFWALGKTEAFPILSFPLWEEISDSASDKRKVFAGQNDLIIGKQYKLIKCPNLPKLEGTTYKPISCYNGNPKMIRVVVTISNGSNPSEAVGLVREFGALNNLWEEVP